MVQTQSDRPLTAPVEISGVGANLPSPDLHGYSCLGIGTVSKPRPGFPVVTGRLSSSIGSSLHAERNWERRLDVLQATAGM
jgi:hypothetical protein